MLPLKRGSNLCVSGECIVFKIYINNEKYFLTGLNRFPTQNCDQVESSSSHLSLTLTDIYVEMPTQPL